jgi:ribosome-binding protein aMBF1 (putative translation factor)
MHETSKVLSSNLASLTERRKKRHTRALTTDRTLQALVADLVAARVASGMTQEEVAARMWTTRSVVPRLESGVRTRPTLTTIEGYAVAVGATVEIRVRMLAHA